MVYNPIFEEEKEKRLQFKKLKKEIKHRARKENLRGVIDRVYKLMQRKPLLTLNMLLQPFWHFFKTQKPQDETLTSSSL